LDLKTIRAEVETTMEKAEMQLRAIVENIQRRDMNPIEEGNAFQTLVDQGYTVAQIAEELGLGSQNVQNRLDLLELDEGVQRLVATGAITASMGWAIRLAPRSQHTRIVREISVGNFKTVEQVRHACIAIRDAEAQLDAFDGSPRASRKDVEAMKTLEAKIEARQPVARQSVG
jgi:ParB-like chromosome segregation protein Spo0J